MPRGEPPFFTSNPAEKPGFQLRTHSTVPGNISTSPAVAVPSVQAAVAPKSPTQSKSSSKEKNESKKNSEELPCLRHYGRAEIPNTVEVLQEEERVIQEMLV
jgi:hypothetical protein